MTAYLFLNLLFFIRFCGYFDCFSELLCEFSFHIQSKLGDTGEKRVVVANVFTTQTYLFPQGRPPSYDSPEVTLSQNLKIFAVCENLWCCQVEVTPSEMCIIDAS